MALDIKNSLLNNELVDLDKGTEYNRLKKDTTQSRIHNCECYLNNSGRIKLSAYQNLRLCHGSIPSLP